MHKNITTKGSIKCEEIYSGEKAVKLHYQKKYGARRLSLMKQENIKEASFGREFTLANLISVVGAPCGYCFGYGGDCCMNCPIVKKAGTPCFDMKSFHIMRRATTKRQFRTWHKRWCKEIGLDVYK